MNPRPAAPPPAPLPIVRIIVKAHAVKLVNRFKEGASPLTLAREHGLSRTGVEELIRAYGWKRSQRKR